MVDRDASFEACRALTRFHAKSFYFSSHTLPKEKRRAAYAIYAFCRYLDDMVDLAPTTILKQKVLEELRIFVRQVFTRELPEEKAPNWLPAFQETVVHYAIPETYFYDLLAGVERDEGSVRIPTWTELETYCYQVASVVGLMMTHILTTPESHHLQPAKDLGTAMQLTNILRDIGEDYQRDRIYLPQEEMAKFGVREEDLAQGRYTESFFALMRFQIGRARDYYQRSEVGIRALPNDGSQLTVWLMRTIYAGILEEIERVDYRVLTQRVHVSTFRKMRLAFKAWRLTR